MARHIWMLIVAILAIVTPSAAFAQSATEMRTAAVRRGEPILSTKERTGFLERNGLTNDDFWAVYVSSKENKSQIGIYCAAITSDEPIDDPKDGERHARRTIRGNFRCWGATPAAGPGAILALPQGREAIRRENGDLRTKLASVRTEADTAKGQASEAAKRADQNWGSLEECNRARGDEDRKTVLAANMIPAPWGFGGGGLFLALLGFAGMRLHRERRRRDLAERSAEIANVSLSAVEKVKNDFFERMNGKFREIEAFEREVKAREAAVGRREKAADERDAALDAREGKLKEAEAVLERARDAFEARRTTFDAEKAEAFRAAAEAGRKEGVEKGRIEALDRMQTDFAEAETEAKKIVAGALSEREDIIRSANEDADQIRVVARSAEEAVRNVSDEVYRERDRVAEEAMRLDAQATEIAARDGATAGAAYVLNARRTEFEEEATRIAQLRGQLEAAIKEPLAEARRLVREELAQERAELEVERRTLKDGQAALDAGREQLAKDRKDLDALRAALETELAAVMTGKAGQPSEPFAPAPSVQMPVTATEPPGDGTSTDGGGVQAAAQTNRRPTDRYPFVPGEKPTGGDVPIPRPSRPPKIPDGTEGDGAPPLTHASSVVVRNPLTDQSTAEQVDAPPATRHSPDADDSIHERVTQPDGPSSRPAIRDSTPEVVVGDDAEESQVHSIEEPPALEDCFVEIPESDALRCGRCGETVPKEEAAGHKHVACQVCPDEPIVRADRYREHAREKHLPKTRRATPRRKTPS